MIRILVLIIISSFFILVCCSCSSQHEVFTNTESADFNEKSNIFVESDENLALTMNNNAERSINTISFNNMWLVFPEADRNEVSRIKIPPNGIIELNTYFRYHLKFCLRSNQVSATLKEKVKEDMILMKNAKITIDNLTKIKLESQNGKRNISQFEAGKLIEFVGVSAVDVCKTADK
jgi:hypothetical protein